ncbi:hypothetical protein KIN20_006936 [Parelaphostrongylus tenuis]|uniref:Uncharacterized protein n=1 Tax=Parelaphostrongylus tenuis TaxID=148309 RepID=A0AAD5MNV6_PARTN|nr:hypothetical protein KIN20_006936 [Parelaphostrongylus tenuis]
MSPSSFPFRVRELVQNLFRNCAGITVTRRMRLIRIALVIVSSSANVARHHVVEGFCNWHMPLKKQDFLVVITGESYD